MPKKTWKLYSRTRGFYLSDEPGRYAAVTTMRIAGRLDCHSGKRAKKENRLFLRHLGDMPEGFRACKICKPENLRPGDRLGHTERRAALLEKSPHISLWATGMLIPGTDRYDPCRWYVALNWHERRTRQEMSMQQTLSPHRRHHQALSIALAEGKRLNLPVIKHSQMEMIVLALPNRASTTTERELVASYLKGKVVSIHGDGPIGVPIAD